MMDPANVHGVCYSDGSQKSVSMYAKEKLQPSLQKDEGITMPTSLVARGHHNCLDSIRLTTSTYQPSIESSAQESDGKLPSCLRQNLGAPRTGGKARSSSFSYPSNKRSLLREQDTRKSLSSIEARVKFQEDVDVVPIASLKDYPDNVRRTLWITNDELAVSMRQAETLALKEQRGKPLDSLEENKKDREGEPYRPSLGEDSTDDEEGSMDFSDLAICIDPDEDNQKLDDALEAMHDMTLSQQVYR
jgi:hypothetical protein